MALRPPRLCGETSEPKPWELDERNERRRKNTDAEWVRFQALARCGGSGSLLLILRFFRPTGCCGTPGLG